MQTAEQCLHNMGAAERPINAPARIAEITASPSTFGQLNGMSAGSVFPVRARGNIQASVDTSARACAGLMFPQYMLCMDVLALCCVAYVLQALLLRSKGTSDRTASSCLFVSAAARLLAFIVCLKPGVGG